MTPLIDAHTLPFTPSIYRHMFYTLSAGAAVTRAADTDCLSAMAPRRRHFSLFVFLFRLPPAVIAAAACCQPLPPPRVFSIRLRRRFHAMSPRPPVVTYASLFCRRRRHAAAFLPSCRHAAQRHKAT